MTMNLLGDSAELNLPIAQCMEKQGDGGNAAIAKKIAEKTIALAGQEALKGGSRFVDVVGPAANGQKSSRSFVEAAKGHNKPWQFKTVDVNLNSLGGVRMPDVFKEKGVNQWRNTLIGVVLGRKLPLGVIDLNVRRMWRKWGVVEMGSAGVGMVFIRFADDKGFEEIIQKGDWTIVGCPFLVRRWTTGLTYGSLEPTSLPLWIRLRNVPFEYCHIEAIEYIVSSFGTPLKMGSGFLSKDGIRVQVEFDASSPLKRTVQLDSGDGKTIEVKVDYEFLPSQCAECTVFGHDTDHCPKSKAKQLVEAHIGREEKKWKVVERRNGTKQVEVMQEIPKNIASLVEEDDVDAVESTFPEEVVGGDIANQIPIAVNSFQVLQGEEVNTSSTPPVGLPRQSPPVRASPVQVHDRFPETFGCCMTTREASLEVCSGDFNTSFTTPSLVIPYGDREDPMEHKEDFMKVFYGDIVLGDSVEDSSRTITDGPLGDNDGDPLGDLVEVESRVEVLASPHRTRNRVVNNTARGGVSAKKVRKSRKAPK